MSIRLDSAPGVVVGNPGSIPEIYALAAGLAKAGLLRRLVLPLSEPGGGIPGFIRSLPEPAARRIRSELSRRRLPAAIPRSAVRHEAVLAEVAFVAAQRIRYGRAPSAAFLRARDELFDRRLAQHVQRGDRAVVATAGAALHTLRQARQLGVTAVLECRILDHRYAERLLQEEARLQPEFAQTLQFHRFSPRLRARLEAELELASRVLVLSTFQADVLTDQGVERERMIVTPLGVDLELFRPGVRAPDGIFRVLFVGQIGQRKGLSYLIEAVRRAEIRELELVLVGDIIGTDRPWRDVPQVRHVPAVPRAELPHLYASADVFVLPSLVEGFPMTPLEALACGLPVIVSENAFGRGVVTDGVDGYVVPIRDADAIAERLRDLHARPDRRRQMGAAARQLAEQFSWDAYGQRVAEAIGALS